MDKKNNELIKITDLTTQLGLSSRSLRYYEQIGLIQSVRPEFEKYRFYNMGTIERLKQIMVLRKMQIPVKDILRIYESESMSVVVETFVNRIHAIDDEIGALAELKRIVGDFLQTMLDNGITKISAIPLLYEEMDKQLAVFEEQKPVTMAELDDVSDKLAKPLDISIVDLPPMRVLTSFRKPGTKESDFSGFSRYIQINGLSVAASGSHQQFEFQTEAGDVLMVRVSEDFINDSEYLDYPFAGGLFATVNIYLDEDLGQCFRALVRQLNANPYYQFAYCTDGTSRHPTLLEDLISPDDKRELVTMLVPVKKRMADPALFDPPIEITDITIAEIEAVNPVLWEIDVPLDKMTPINSPHYKVLDNGEVEYTGWIGTRVLNTNVAVKFPFRVDVEWRTDFSRAEFGYGSSEGSLDIHHGSDINFAFCVNAGNNPDDRLSMEALTFYQPIFKNRYHFNKRGQINHDGYNRVTWILGQTHLVAIVNDEIRYCGVNFPYMSFDLNREECLPIIVGGDGQSMRYFRSIKVSQLMYTPKNKIKKEELVMITKQSNNIISTIHRLVTSEYGENYWINGSMKYVMECLGETDYDYQFFAGLTGDMFTQHYSHTNFAGEAISSYLSDENPARFFEDTFLKCGYAATYVASEEVLKNTEMYLQTLIAYIDKGIPVIKCGNPEGVFVGYEDYGKILLYITGDKNEPERVEIDKVFESKPFHGYEYKSGWIFVGDKKEDLPLAEVYRRAVKNIIPLQSVKTDTYCFGAEAFRAWARDIENGKFDKMMIEDFDTCCDHTNYVCVLATNGSCCHGFLQRAQELNPDMSFLEEVSRLYRRIAEMWGGDNNRNDTDSLEILGGGFNVTLGVLQDKQKRGKIVAKIREFANVTDEIVRVLTDGINKTEGEK